VNTLGATAYRADTLVPLVVYGDGSPVISTEISVVIRAGFLSDQLLWRLQGDCTTNKDWAKVNGPFFAPRSPIKLVIPKPLPGQCSLSIAAHEPNNQWVYNLWKLAE
jgi:hypothetical protein